MTTGSGFDHVLLKIASNQQKMVNMKGMSIVSSNQTLLPSYTTNLIASMGKYFKSVDPNSLNEENLEKLNQMKAFVAICSCFGLDDLKLGVKTEQAVNITALYTPSVVALNEKVGLLFGGKFLPLKPINTEIGTMWGYSSEETSDGQIIKIILTTEMKSGLNNEYCSGKLIIKMMDNDKPSLMHDLVSRVCVKFEGENDLYSGKTVNQAFNMGDYDSLVNMLAETPLRWSITGVNPWGKEVSINYVQPLVELPYGVYPIYDCVKHNSTFTKDGKTIPSIKYYVQVSPDKIGGKTWVKVDKKSFNESRIILDTLIDDPLDNFLYDDGETTLGKNYTAILIFTNVKHNTMTNDASEVINYKTPVVSFTIEENLEKSFLTMDEWGELQNDKNKQVMDAAMNN